MPTTNLLITLLSQRAQDVLGDTSKSHSTLFKGLKLFRVHERFSKVIKMKRKWKIYKQNRWNRNILQNANSFHVHWNGTRVPRKNFVHKKCLFSYFFQSHSSLKVENIFLIHDISNWVVEAVKFFRVWFNPFQPFFSHNNGLSIGWQSVFLHTVLKIVLLFLRILPKLQHL